MQIYQLSVTEDTKKGHLKHEEGPRTHSVLALRARIDQEAFTFLLTRQKTAGSKA